MTNSNHSTATGIVFSESSDKEQRFSDFEELPSSGAHRIFRAKRFGRWWMLKALKAGLRDSEAHCAQLRKTFEQLIVLQHPGIAQGVMIGTLDGIGLCFVTEWIDGMTLREWLATPRSQEERRRVAWQLAEVLDCVHAHGVTHGSLTLSDIMIERSGGQVKLIGFGASDADAQSDFRAFAGVLEDLKLGWAYAPVVWRCRRGAMGSRSGGDGGGIRRAFRCGQTAKHVGIALLVLALFVGSVALSWDRTPPRDERAYALVDSLGNALEDSRSRADTLRQTVATLRADLAAASEEQKVWERKEQRILEVIEEGKRKLDRASRYDLDTLTTFEACSESYWALLNRLGPVFRNHIYEIQPEIPELDLEYVKRILVGHYNVCINPLYQKAASLREQAKDKSRNHLFSFPYPMQNPDLSL